MPANTNRVRWLIAAAVAALTLSSPSLPCAIAQAGAYAVEIVKVDPTRKQLTFKASMGQQTMRVAPGVVLDGLKPGDKVLITFGQERKESVIARIERVER